MNNADARASEFNQFALLLLRGGGNLLHTKELAISSSAPSRVVSVLKAAVQAGSTSNAVWAQMLTDYRAIVEGFFASLSTAGIFDHLLQNGFRAVPMQTRLVANTSIVVGSSPVEGMAKPLTQFALNGINLAPRKAVAIIALSDELVKSTSAEAMAFLGSELRVGTIAATDAAFLNLMAQDAPSVAASPGGLKLDDLKLLLELVSFGLGSKLFLIVRSDQARQMATMASNDVAVFPQMTPLGGLMAGIRVLVSDGLTAGTALLIDASQVAANGGTVTLDNSKNASIQMDSAPVTPPIAATVLTPLWQLNLIGLRSERTFACAKARPDACAVLTGLPTAQFLDRK